MCDWSIETTTPTQWPHKHMCTQTNKWSWKVSNDNDKRLVLSAQLHKDTRNAEGAMGRQNLWRVCLYCNGPHISNPYLVSFKSNRDQVAASLPISLSILPWAVYGWYQRIWLSNNRSFRQVLKYMYQVVVIFVSVNWSYNCSHSIT